MNGGLVFPRAVRSPGAPVALETVSVAIGEELWAHILSDRAAPGRADVWPGIATLGALTNYLVEKEEALETGAGAVYLARGLDGELLGSFYVHEVSWVHRRAELGYLVHHAFEGNGFASAMLRLVEPVLAGLGFHRLVIRTALHNARSIALAERNGYAREGVARGDTLRDGQFEDSIVFAKILGGCG